MKSWREDRRFQCPHCRHVIYLTELEPNEHPMTRCGVVAICIPCRRIFLAEEWRIRPDLRNPEMSR